MNTQRRLDIYLRDVIYQTDGDGYYRVTHKQRRRVNHKARKRGDVYLIRERT